MSNAAHYGFEQIEGIALILEGADQLWRGVYRVAEDVRQWDGTDAELAIDVPRHEGVKSYVSIKVTGRDSQWSSDLDCWTIRAVVKFEDGSKARARISGVMNREKLKELLK